MLTSPLMSSSPLPPPEALDSRRIPGPTSKVSIFLRNLHSRRGLGGGIGRTGAPHQKNATGPVGIDALAGAANGREDEVEIEVGVDLENSGHLAAEGFETTVNRMSKWLVVAFFALFILWKHDAEALWVAMGSVVNSCMSVTLKRALNHQRPVNASKTDPGMPSSHAQTIFYTATYLSISLINWPGVNIFTMTIGAITFVSSSYLSWLRVSQQFHTISQVLVGAALGSACAVTWFWTWHMFVQAAFAASLWVRIVVFLGSISFCTVLVLHVIQQWVGDED